MNQSPAVTPSGSRSSTPARSAAPAVVTRNTPSAPRPRRRSHSAPTAARVRSYSTPRSGSTTKSFWVPWPLAKSMASGYVPVDGQCRVQQTSGGAVEPGDAVVAAKPGPLPAHIAAGADERRLARTLAVPARIEVGDHLRVTQRPRGGHPLAQPGCPQPRDLRRQAPGEPPPGAGGPPPVRHGRG